MRCPDTETIEEMIEKAKEASVSGGKHASVYLNAQDALGALQMLNHRNQQVLALYERLYAIGNLAGQIQKHISLGSWPIDPEEGQ